MSAPTRAAGMLLLSVLGSGCASSPEVSDRPTVQLVGHKERSSTATVYVQWVGFEATRLGVIAGSSADVLPAVRPRLLS